MNTCKQNDTYESVQKGDKQLLVDTEKRREKMAGLNEWGGVNSRRNLPYNPYAMAAVGVAVVGGIWYMYRNKSNVTRGRGA
ncbi:hypothetical protein SASPL_104822 [Salvia splendens]|uniref:Uncharacterized protein n=1 Tax=Salvia splendens TaxID=180675 RepID=A0A8X9AB18_SALSN|nr:hypothetical protein SASPL_104822 [Salvia splendens]